MSSNDAASLLDRAALALQTLCGDKHAVSNVLLRIDNTAEAAAAPYQFDAALGRLHRRGCRAIPEMAPVYGLWHLTRDNLKHACKRCRPLPEEPHSEDTKDRADLLFGLVSLMDQFGHVLKERGRDFQNTEEGRQLSSQLGAIYDGLGRREQEVLDTVLSALDAVIEKLRKLDRSLNGNGSDGGG